MGRYLDIADEWERTRKRSDFIDGHKVERVIWETEKAVVFADEHGHYWRYLRAYRQSWPVIVEGGK
jgi:hypothetical protein